LIRPAVITDEISQDFERALDVMLEHGVRDAELRGLWGANVMDLAPEQCDRAREALHSRGMRACGIASPLFKCYLRDEPSAAGETGALHLAGRRTLAEQLPLLERAIDLARFFETDLIRIFAFWRQGDPTPAIQEEIVAALRPAVARAEAAGVVLGLENEHACFLGTGVETAPVPAAIASPALRVVWDPGNAYMAGETPYPDGYEAIRPWLRHVHVKDVALGPDGTPQWTIVGRGVIDFPGQIAALREDGYDGLLSLETHYKAPSGDPEEASRVCLRGLLELLGER